MPEPSEAAPQPEVSTIAAEELDAITGKLRELKAQAILHPTPENVAAYIRFQREQLDRASLFSDVWQRALWQDPALDYTLERPVGALAKKQWQDARAAERDAVMAGLSARYGLFYFFAQTCILQADVGIASDRKFLLELADPVAKSPELAAGRSDLNVEAAVVSNLVGFVLGFEGAKPSLSQRHVRAFSQCGFCKGPQKARKNVRNPRENAGRSGTIQGPNPLDFCGFYRLSGRT
jgi:hypothetical protein